MFDSNTFTQKMLSNPTLLTKTVIDAMEKNDATGQTLINDPNNGFVLQLHSYLSVMSTLSEKIDNTMSYIYPQRSRNAEQLYPHLSEFEYYKLMASPATLPFSFAMDADWIRANGVYYDTNYDKLEIPATSYITMGGIVYSMYHPIEILINRNTKAITAFYDGNSENSLNQLATNMLKDVAEYTQDGINWFRVTFDMFQFERQTTSYTVSQEQGFNKTLTFDDQFYAVKIFTKQRGNDWTELNYSLTQLYYDYKTPTAILQLLNDTAQLKINIPQIYFDNNQIGQSVKVELYTTKGKVNYTLSSGDVDTRRANFDTASSVYAAPLEQMPSWWIFPTQIEVAGGSDVMTYDEIREAIVNQSLTDRVAVTTQEVIKKGRRAGFELTRIKDDLTERIYFASNVLTDSSGMIIPTFTGGILIKDESLTGNPSTIINHTDGYYTILPTTTFKISNNGNTCVPMTDGEVTAMSGMTKQQMVDELNKGIYVRQPFHITLHTNPKSPQTLIYNLLSPSMESLVFVAENAHSAPQMSVTKCDVTHEANGTGGYRLLLNMTRSSNIVEADANNFKVIVSCPNKGGDFVYLPATYVGTSSDDVDTWEVVLNTNYHLTDDDFITVDMYDDQDILSGVEISINQTFDVVAAFRQSFEPDVPIDPALNAFIPSSLRTQLVGMARQTMRMSLGKNLSSQIYCAVNTSWGNDVYKTAPDNIYLQNNTPVFQLTEDTQVINTRYNETTDKLETVLIYPIGSTPSDTADIEVKTLEDVLPPSGSTTTFKVSNVVGLLVGMDVRGTNIPVGTKLTAIGANTVTLSQKTVKLVAADTTLIFNNQQSNVRTTAVQPAIGDQLSVASTRNLVVGQSVFGFDIPTGAKIKSIDSATAFTITKPTTAPVAANTLLTIINTTAAGVIKIAKGSVVTDAASRAIIVKSAQNQYLIPSILFDGRLFASEDPIDQEVIGTIAGRLNNFANQISTIDAGLIEDSDVYYTPSRSMGFADFGIGGNETINLSLELSFTVLVYVDAAIYNSQTLLQTMEDTIGTIINQEIQKPTISVSVITKTISDRLGTNAAAVEMGPISGRDGLRLVSINQPNIIPSIENTLVVEADGHINRKPNIVVKYLPKPDTAEATIKASL
jgi:hypothetical protein